MAEKAAASPAKVEAPELKRKLAWRMGVAGLMIVVLLAVLAMFDRLNTPDDEEESPRFTAPVPTAKPTPAPAQTATQPVTQAASGTPSAETPTKLIDKAPVAESSAAPTRPATPAATAAEAPARPEVAAQPSPSRAAAPAHNAPAEKSPKASPPVVSTAPAPAAANPPAARPAAAPAQASAAAAAPPAAPAAAPALPNTTPRLLSGFALQTGVFSDVRRAEEMHAMLTLNGIPSTIEARVQAGPFRSRAEAKAARAKLEALGIDSVLLSPPKASSRH
ncbi:SPOR domain-containing protein [Rhodocyclus tenuis]|uniref:SPOR domain-containing protein n=1 Tax=Rhodocyclus gracilis TaxID=2929842 RepID=A0ABX0WFW0_9RHOO|nr:SPOR domain-containing protein [Rhodocyclus gracilis]MRD74049.1 SPOR domain-containing protein [Rhodocyclus gracilis]NJA88604.1 SPOR domain-containing protein [Rhodocyclus gracilis]